VSAKVRTFSLKLAVWIEVLADRIVIGNSDLARRSIDEGDRESALICQTIQH